MEHMERAASGGLRIVVMFVAGAFFFGCQERDPVVPAGAAVGKGILRLQIEPYWGALPFDKHEIYLDGLGHRVQVGQLKFYLGDIRLTSAHGDDLATDIDIFDVTDGPVVRQYMLPVDGYDGIRFGIGVPSALNHSDPVLYPITHPLSANNGMYWSWASMYRFVIFDGWFDNDVNGSGQPPFAYSIHTGRDTCYRTTTLAGAIQLSESAETTLRLKVDISRFFTDGTDTLNLSAGSQSHGSLPELPIAIRLSDLVATSFSINE